MIEKIYADTFYKDYCVSLVKNKVKSEELHSEFILIILELDENKLKSLIKSKEFKYYAISIIKNLAFNKKTPFAKNNNSIIEKATNNLQEENEYTYKENVADIGYYNDKETKQLLGRVTDKLLNIDNENEWYEMKVFMLYHTKFKTFREMSEHTKIPYLSIFRTVKKTTKMLKKEYNNRYLKIKENALL